MERMVCTKLRERVGGGGGGGGVCVCVVSRARPGPELVLVVTGTEYDLRGAEQIVRRRETPLGASASHDLLAGK